MQTRVLRISSKRPERSKIEIAARVIRQGGLVAFPTETVYGLGANALDAGAVKAIFMAKGRPSDNPMIVHIANRADVFRLAKVSDAQRLLVDKLADKFWPGPLTIVLKKRPIIPDVVTAGMDTVAIRMPAHPIALALIKTAGVPIAAPSANISGRPSPTTAQHVIDDLNGKVDTIIYSEKAAVGIESTVIDLTTNPPTLLRPGKVSLEELVSAQGAVAVHPVVRVSGIVDAAKAPGMKYRHYAPRAELIVVEGPPDKVKTEIDRLHAFYRNAGKKVGVMRLSEEKAGDVASSLFKRFRDYDKKSIDVILAEGISEKGVGLAVMNRLRKAAHKMLKI